MFHPAIKTAPRLIFLLTFVNNLRSVVLSPQHWINLNLWHDDLAVWEQQSTMENSNFTTVTNPGGRQVSGLPGCHELDALTEGQMKLCLLFFDHMRPVIQGAKLGLSECRWQFRHHHWNCSVLPMDILPPPLPSPSSPLQEQSRVLRENKNVNVNSNSKSNPSSYSNSRRRNVRNQQEKKDEDEGVESENQQNGNSGMVFEKEKPLTREQSYPSEYFIHNPNPKPRKKGRKHSGSNNNNNNNNSNSNSNMVLTSTGSGSNRNGKRNQNHQQQFIPVHNHKEEKANWDSMLTRGTKEVAFAQAVWSAAVTEAVARSCREGSISSCGCGKTPRPSDLKSEWRWGGCGDNLQYGYKFAQSFVDIREQENSPTDKKTRARALINLHNNEAGRRAVLKKTKIACKCHGVSGSCALVTCWHQIPSFREIGDYLKVRYQKATQVKLNKRGRLQVKKSGVPVPSVVDLVYVETSPNYCVQNETLGIYGTTGRVCNRNVSSPNSCKNLCCNRGYTTNVVKSDHRCNCKFIWCCQVVCEECRSVQKYDVCK